MNTYCDALVVDDDDDLRETLVSTLQDEGLCAAAARNGLEALSWLRAGRRPGVILLDFSMPLMDAPAFRREQRADPDIAGVPVVLMSASRAFEIEGDPEPLPRLLKPVSLDRLIDVVRQYRECQGAREGAGGCAGGAGAAEEGVSCSSRA